MRNLSRAAAAFAIAVLTLAALPFGAVAVADPGDPPVNGGGSSFAKLAIDQWRSEVARAPYRLSVNYVAQGSTFGRSQYASGQLEFGVSDVPFTQAELSALPPARADFVYVPIAAAGLGLMYNLIDQSGSRITNLNLTRRAACRIFSEPSMRWNDPEIVDANPGIRLPDQEILPVVRADGAGTSFVLSEFCLTVAPDVWQAFRDRLANDPGVDGDFKRGLPTAFWPRTARSGIGADGVAAQVAAASGLYAVTYVEAGFAQVLGLPNASLQNQAGVFVQPTSSAITQGLGYASPRADGTFILDFSATDPDAYFPATYSYVIAQTTGFDVVKGKVLGRFLCYSITTGQRVELTSALGYSSLAPGLVQLARNQIARIPGAPAPADCVDQRTTEPPVVPEFPMVALSTATAVLVACSMLWITRRRGLRAAAPRP